MKYSDSKSTWLKIGFAAAVVLLIMLTGAVDAVAQNAPGPPVFPGTPSEAPIDGGLGLLAAAGGAYAWKKLRGKSSD